jgi:hypothetical protein
MKEWNISYYIHDGYGGLDEFIVVLPKFWKVVWWFIRRGRKCCEVYIWTSHKIANEEDFHG